VAASEPFEVHDSSLDMPPSSGCSRTRSTAGLYDDGSIAEEDDPRRLHKRSKHALSTDEANGAISAVPPAPTVTTPAPTAGPGGVAGCSSSTAERDKTIAAPALCAGSPHAQLKGFEQPAEAQHDSASLESSASSISVKSEPRSDDERQQQQQQHCDHCNSAYCVCALDGHNHDSDIKAATLGTDTGPSVSVAANTVTVAAFQANSDSNADADGTISSSDSSSDSSASSSAAAGSKAKSSEATTATTSSVPHTSGTVGSSTAGTAAITNSSAGQAAPAATELAFTATAAAASTATVTAATTSGRTGGTCTGVLALANGDELLMQQFGLLKCFNEQGGFTEEFRGQQSTKLVADWNKERSVHTVDALSLKLEVLKRLCDLDLISSAFFQGQAEVAWQSYIEATTATATAATATTAAAAAALP
jgi:hypothetical protein